MHMLSASLVLPFTVTYPSWAPTSHIKYSTLHVKVPPHHSPCHIPNSCLSSDLCLINSLGPYISILLHDSIPKELAIALTFAKPTVKWRGRILLFTPSSLNVSNVESSHFEWQTHTLRILSFWVTNSNFKKPYFPRLMSNFNEIWWIWIHIKSRFL